MCSEGARAATDMEIEAEDPAELPPLGGIKIQALRPTVHPPQPRPTGNRIERPSFTRPALFQLFAEAFRPLPTLFSRFGDLTTKWGKRYSGWEIFTWLFPSMASKAPDPLPNPADATPATPDTPFQALVDRFVDLDSTFADARKMSQPQIVPESVDHLTFLPAPSPSPFKLPALLEYLSARIDPTLADLRAHDLSPPPFLTLIVGSPAHPLAGKAFHSHLVGCFTNNETRYHFTLFVPVGHDQCLPVPLEWAPLFTALATICLYPSLPFLVCTPDYTLGTFSAVDDLIACSPRPAAFHAFSSNSSLVRPDVFLRLPPAANFTGQPVEGRPDFVSHTPAAAMTALLDARKATYQHCPSSRESVEAGSLTADLHFALYCTPYYGYLPENETDFIAMTFALADFLVYTCFTTNSEPNAALSNLSVRRGDLLTILSTIHPSFLSVSPGDGLFILPLTTSKAALRPFPVAWLYSVTEEDCPPPPFFVTLGAALGPGTELYVSGIFQQAWALGPHARVYLNSSQLPLPYFRRTDDLQVHTNNRAHGADFGGYGAKQYHFVFSPDTRDKVSFANLPVTPDALPESFLSDLLALEKWPPAATLLATPNNTISWPDTSSLRMWLPDVDSNFSPHHGITVCCGRAGDRARSHGPTLGYRDIHQESADRQGAVWNSYFSHVPQYESLASVFYSTMEYWVGYTADAIPRPTIEPILTSYKELCSQYQAGLHAWRLPPHTLAYNLYTLIFSLYALDSLLLEGFGAGAYSAAVAALMAYRPPSRAEYSKFDCVLTCLGGIAMPPKIFQELLDVYYKAHSQQLELANDSAAKGHVYDESSFTHSLRIVQHVHDRISPWSLNEILLNYLYNRGVAVLTLHDGVDAQRAYAELHNQIPFKPWSHFGDYRHNYEKVVPTLKYFSAATFFASFLAPLTYEQLEAREGTLGATYCPDLLDLLLGLFSYMGIVPPLHFGATIDALTPVLLRGCHREPNGDIIPMLHTTMEIHESPEAFYSRTFLQLLRIPALKNLGFSQDDVHALEDCLRQALMNLPLPQALDFLHSQLLSSMCISPPVRKDNEPPAPFVSPLLKRHFQWPPGTPDPPPAPPSFHVWITRKVAPHMAVVDLRCDTVPWACFRRGPAGQHQHQFGIHSGDFIQFVFPATDDYPADCGLFSFALYITKVALKGRVVLENPDQVGDPSAAQVTQLVGIVLPFLLHNSVQIPGGKGVAPVSQALYQLRLPVLDRLNTTVETCVLPPISLSLSFLVPVSAFPGLFQHLIGVPFYRLPKTLGWPYSDAPLNGALIPDPPLAPLNLAPLLSLLRVLPFFTPPSVRNKVTNHLQGESGCHYTLDAIVYILEKGMRPGTKKTDGDIETTYDWPLNWEIPDFTSDLCKGLSTHHPEIFQLLTSLGRRFIAKFLIALLAADGHFITLLLSTLWGLRGGFTTLCLQGIFGSGKTYCASMMLVVANSILGIPTLLTAEPNLPLYTAADTICDLLRDASDPVRAQYARLLAQNIPVSTPIDYGQEDRANLFQENSPLRCVLITQGGLLRQLCHSYSHLSTFIKKVRLAFNDESQQGGKAGFTVIGANLPCSCLQCLTGDQEQTKAGTGGEKLQEALFDQLAHKAIGFLGGSKPHLPSSMLLSLFKALRTAQVSNLPSDRDSPFDILQYLCDSSLPFSCLPATVWEAEGMVPTAGVTLHLILPHSLRCPAVLSRLSHAHPWTSLILDLRDLMPDLDRHYHHQLLVAMLQPNPPHITPFIVVDQFLYCLAITITNILTPPNSQVDPPEIDSFFFHPTFWHRHLIHGTNLASPSFFDASLVDTLAGNQLCQWSTVGAAEGRGTNQKDALLLASHLTIHLPPRVGAYVLASHPDLAKITSDSTGSETNSRSQFQVRQNAQFRSPQHLAQPQAAIDAAREQAILGHVPAHLIPALASPNTDIINRKITWTLRFPLPAPAEGDPQNHRFADLALHASGHRSAAALRNALQLATTTAPPDHEPSNARFIRLPDPTNGHNNAMLQPFDGYAGSYSCLITSSRMLLPAYCPEALFLFFSGNSAFPYAPGSSPNTKRTSQRRSLKPKLHSTEPRRPIASPITVSKSICQRPLFLTLASSSHTSPGHASLPAAALAVRPRLASAQPHSQRATPPRNIPPGNTITTSRRLQTPLEPHQVLTRVKVKASFPIPPPLHIPGKNKGKGKFTPKGSEKGKRIRQRFWKRSRQGQRQRQRKRKRPQITLARDASSHCNGITPLRMAAAPPYRCTACPRYKGTSQPTPTTHSPLAAPPFRCTCLAPLPHLLDSTFREHIWRLHHTGAPASPYLI